MRILAVPLLVAALQVPAQPPPAQPPPARPPPFRASIQPLRGPLHAKVAAHLWHRGCPVGLSRLRVLIVTYRGFDDLAHTGRLVVNSAAAGPLVKVFHRLYRLRFDIRRMRPLGAYDDTSAFDCRDASPSPCPGSSPTHHWSEHAYGEAVDLNPVENPYTGCGRTRQRASIPYLDRSRHRRGMVTRAVVAAFAAIGWGWGGNWTGTKDYMHFSATGH
jgi:hypothetical protein